MAPVRRTSTLGEVAPRFLDGYARANREKPSGIAGRQSILRAHLLPAFGDRPLDQVTTEGVQRLKGTLTHRSPKTVNNILTVLNVMLKAAVEWNVIDKLPCAIRLVKTVKPKARFHDFPAYAQLVDVARLDSLLAYLVVLLGAEAGLRCGEIMALEWSHVDLSSGWLTVAQSEWPASNSSC